MLKLGFIILLIGITAITNKTFYESSIIAIAENNSMQALVVKMQKRYHHATTTDTAGNNTRPRIYIHALKLIREEPWIGSGVGSYEEALRRYQPDFHNATSIGKKNPHKKNEASIVMFIQNNPVALSSGE